MVFMQKPPLPFIILWLVGFPAKKPAIHKSMNGGFFMGKSPPFIIWWLAGLPAKIPAIHKLMNGGFSWKKAHHSPIYKLRLVNKSPKDAEDINKLTYQKTGLDWSRPVLEFSKWQGTADRTAVTALCGPVISGPGWSESGPVPVFFQSWDRTSKHYINMPQSVLEVF